jgi:mono/diheme cytochrome c family protein
MNRGRLGSVLAVVVLATGAAAEAEPILERGRRVYEESCAVCHGVAGDGKGPEAHRLRIKPRDFRRGLFKFRSTQSGALPLDSDLFRVLSRGVPGTSMIPQTYLSEDERWTVIEYLKRFSDRFSNENPAAPLEIPPVPPELPRLAESGRRMYREAGCGTCHGSATDLTDAWGQPIEAPDLARRPWKSGSSAADLYRTLATGLNGTPMPSYADSLTEEQMWAVVAYARSLAPHRARTSGGMMGAGEEPVGRMIEMMNSMMR